MTPTLFVNAKHRGIFATLLATLLIRLATGGQVHAQVSFEQDAGKLELTLDGNRIATYVFRDPEIPRPYFANVRSPYGRQVTRNHPPVPDKDRTDHDTMHPGIWMAFGDLDGEDFWRNRGQTRHLRFIEAPHGHNEAGGFTEEKLYVRSDGLEICRELFRCQILVRPGGYLLTWDSTFSADQEFFFGDQEEMGLGIRVATPINELSGGELTDADRRRGAKSIWSQSSQWCDYSAIIDERSLGMTLMCHPDNFRPSWMHARDYGLVAANPFGRSAMKKGEPSRIRVKPGKPLRLRYAVWVHDTPVNMPSDIATVYSDYVDAGIDAIKR